MVVVEGGGNVLHHVKKEEELSEGDCPDPHAGRGATHFDHGLFARVSTPSNDVSQQTTSCV